MIAYPDDPQCLNRYGYCRRNPVKYIDPSGNFWWFIAALFAVIAKVASVVAAVATVGAIVSATCGNQNLANIFGKLAMVSGAVALVAGGISMAAQSIAVKQASYNAFVDQALESWQANKGAQLDIQDIPSYMAGDANPGQIGQINEVATELASNIGMSEEAAQTIGSKIISVSQDSLTAVEQASTISESNRIFLEPIIAKGNASYVRKVVEGAMDAVGTTLEIGGLVTNTPLASSLGTSLNVHSAAIFPSNPISTALGWAATACTAGAFIYPPAAPILLPLAASLSVHANAIKYLPNPISPVPVENRIYPQINYIGELR
jgi:hypothetical protein